MFEYLTQQDSDIQCRETLQEYFQDVFCSEDCLEEAMGSYHPKESLVLQVLEESNLVQEEWFLALRAILNKPLSYFLERRKELTLEMDRTWATNLKESEVYSSNDYKSLFNLVRCKQLFF